MVFDPARDFVTQIPYLRSCIFALEMSIEAEVGSVLKDKNVIYLNRGLPFNRYSFIVIKIGIWCTVDGGTSIWYSVYFFISCVK